MLRNPETGVWKSPSDKKNEGAGESTDTCRLPGPQTVFNRLIRTYRVLVAASLISTLFWAGLCLIPPPLFRLINHKIYDVMHHRLPTLPGPGKPVIIDIDEESLAEIGQWPWPRYTVGRLVMKIQDMGASAVGLDIVFAEPDRTSVHVLQKDLSREIGAAVHILGVPDNYRNNDILFADVLSSGPFVLGYPFFYSPKSIPYTAGCDLHPLKLLVASSKKVDPQNLDLPLARDVTPNLDRFCNAAAASGFINASPDEDGVLRKIGMITRFRNRFYPGLALATVVEAYNAKNIVLEVTRRTPEYLKMTVRGRPVRIPLDKEGHLMIRYYARPGFFETISASDVLKGRIQTDSLAGRIAFVGSSAPALSDAHPTPLHPLVPGIELHATVAQNILGNDFVARLWWGIWTESALVLAVGILSTVLLLWRRALAGFLVIGLFGIGIWYGCQILLSRTGLFISPQFPIIAMISNFSMLTLVKFTRVELNSRETGEMLLNAQELTLHSLASLADFFFNDTATTEIYTQEYVRLLAEYLSRTSCNYTEFSDKEKIAFLYKSAPLHDIGKVGIPDRILLKPEKLTVEEFELMKRHTEYGRDALLRAEERLGDSMVSPYFRYARDVVYSHHEQWSGEGYPEGLAGKEIPLAGRLMALADIYDALRTKRVYKPAFSHRKTRAIILSGRDTHFDPEVVDAFVALEDRFLEISEKYADPADHSESEDAPLHLHRRSQP